MTTTTSKTAASSHRTDSTDAIAMLTADHKAVKALFKQFDDLKEQDDAGDEKARLVTRICGELSIHARIEEELFYPAVRAAIDDEALLDEADIEHASAKDLIAQLEGMEPGDDHYDARVTVLGEYIDHHVKEEEGEIFVKARKADLDTEGLGEQMAERKDELMAELGLAEEDEPGASKTKKSPAAGKAKAKVR